MSQRASSQPSALLKKATLALRSRAGAFGLRSCRDRWSTASSNWCSPHRGRVLSTVWDMGRLREKNVCRLSNEKTRACSTARGSLARGEPPYLIGGRSSGHEGCGAPGRGRESRGRHGHRVSPRRCARAEQLDADSLTPAYVGASGAPPSRGHAARSRHSPGRGQYSGGGRRLTHPRRPRRIRGRSEEHTSELQSQSNLVCRLLLEKKKILVMETCVGELPVAPSETAA